MTQASEYQGPLTGLNVIDFGHYYAGPMAAMLLADQGADVIRIVRPGEKELPDQQYRLLSRNKKLLTLDLKTPKGKARAESLIEKSDVVIENFRPGVMKHLELDYASVKESHPGLVYLSLPGFASTDKERAQIQAWEGVMAAAAGVYTQVSPVHQFLNFPPVYTSVPHVSTYGAMNGLVAIMAALLSRERHGYGTVVEAPLVDSSLVSLTVNFMQKIPFGPRGSTVPEMGLPASLKPYIYSPQDSESIQLEKLEMAHGYLPALDSKDVYFLESKDKH